MVGSIYLKYFFIARQIFFLLNSFSLVQSYTGKLHFLSWGYFSNASMLTSL